MTTDAGAFSLYAADAILARVEPMLREIPGVTAADDPEPLHRMRVASRRLRTALRLLAPRAGLPNAKALLKLARRVTRTLGEARDLDVQIAWLGVFAGACAPRERPGVSRAALRLRQRREAVQPRVVRLVSGLADDPVLAEALRSLREGRLRAEMSGADDPLRDLEHATRVICLQLDALHGQAPSLQSPGDFAGHHELRIEAKRLRYAMEIFGGLYGEGALDEQLATVRKLQALLGDLHDADVWIEAMPSFMEREERRTARYFGDAMPFARLRRGCDAIVRDRRAFRAAQYERARAFYEETQSEGKWEALRTLTLAAYRNRRFNEGA